MDASSDVEPALVSEAERSTSERRVAWAGLALAMYVSGWFAHSFQGSFALDVDPMNFVYAMRRFAIEESSPHAPGYLLYVGLLRALHAITGADESLTARFETTESLALLFHVTTVPVVFAVIRRVRPEAPQLAGLAALLTAFHPFLVFHAIDAQMHGSEAFAAAVLLFGLVRYRERPTLVTAVLLGMVLAFGAGLRPSFVVIGVGPIVYVCRRRPLHVLVAGASAMVGAALWIVPTLRVSGGYDVWKAANDALVGEVFVRNASVLSDAGIPEFQRHQLRATLLWIALLLSPVIAGGIAIALQRKPIQATDLAVNAGAQLGGIALVATIPTLVFYLLLFCSEPGYFSGLVPFLIAWVVTRPATVWSLRARRVAPLASMAIQAMILLAPSGSAVQVKIPSLHELVERDLLSRAWMSAFDRISRPGRLLVVGDFPDVAIPRQIAMQRPGTHYLGFYSDEFPAFRHTTGSLLTEENWMPIPGPIHLVSGPPQIIEVDETYDWVIIDLLASRSLRASIAPAITCGASVGDVGDFAVVPASCIRDGALSLDGQGIRFRASGGAMGASIP